MRKFIISMIAVFIIGYFLVEIYRNERQKNANIQLEEARFMRFAKHRIKENKLKKIPEFKFRYTPAKKQAELIEEMYFTGIAQRYLELGKFSKSQIEERCG